MTRLATGRVSCIACLAAAAVAAGACGTGGSSPAAMPAPMVTHAGAAGTASPLLPGALMPQPSLSSDSAAAGLNTQLMRHVRTPAGASDLPLGPGDLIEVSVFDVEELSKLKLRISIRGTITLPLIGEIHAAGRTAIELEHHIRAKLEQEYMHSPQVSVFVHDQKSQRISVIGAVRRGGIFTITSPLQLADALALAEGLADDAAHTIYLIRRVPAGTAVQLEAGVTSPKLPPGSEDATEQVMVPIDLELLAGGRDELNVALQAGDVINVPRAGSYYVGGSVERPGSFLLKGKTTVDQGVTAAGGPRTVADWDDVRIYRVRPGGEREILSFNMNEFEKGNGQQAPELQKNDLIIVGKSTIKAVLFGTLDFIRGMFSISRGL